MSKAAEFQIIQRVKAVNTDTSLKPTERLMLSHLMLAAGESGETFWFHKNLARAIGISDRQSQRITATLHENDYLNSIQQGLKRSNKYLMPWHAAFCKSTPMAEQKQAEPTPMAVLEPTPMSYQEATPAAVPIGKESFLKDLEAKDTSSSSSVPPEVPRRLEEEEEVPILSSQILHRTAEEVQLFREMLHGEMGGDTPSRHFVEDCLNQAPTWTIPEIVQAFKINSQERVFKPKSYRLFTIALQNLFKEWEGIPPEVPAVKISSFYEAENPERAERTEQPLVPAKLKFEYCHDTGEFPKGSTCRYECKAGLKRCAEIHANRYQEQSKRWDELISQQSDSVKDWMKFRGALVFMEDDDLTRREALLNQIALGRHPLQQGTGTDRMPPGAMKDYVCMVAA